MLNIPVFLVCFGDSFRTVSNQLQIIWKEFENGACGGASDVTLSNNIAAAMAVSLAELAKKMRRFYVALLGFDCSTHQKHSYYECA